MTFPDKYVCFKIDSHLLKAFKISIAIEDYGMGNINSVKNTLKHIEFEVEVIDNVENLYSFSTIIFPVIGAFEKAMERLKSTGLDEALRVAAESGKKIVGICLCMQLLFDKSREFGIHNELGLKKKYYTEN